MAKSNAAWHKDRSGAPHLAEAEYSDLKIQRLGHPCRWHHRCQEGSCVPDAQIWSAPLHHHKKYALYHYRDAHPSQRLLPFQPYRHAGQLAQPPQYYSTDKIHLENQAGNDVQAVATRHRHCQAVRQVRQKAPV